MGSKLRHLVRLLKKHGFIFRAKSERDFYSYYFASYQKPIPKGSDGSGMTSYYFIKKNDHYLIEGISPCELSMHFDATREFPVEIIAAINAVNKELAGKRGMYNVYDERQR